MHRPKSKGELDKLIEKKEKEKYQQPPKKEGKPSCQMTIESMMRFKKDKPPTKDNNEFINNEEYSNNNESRGNEKRA